MSRGRIFRTAILAAAVALFPRPAAAQTDTSVTGAGGATLASAVLFNGVSLSSLEFGFGVDIAAAGTARGDFESTLLGTSPLGQTRTVTVEGKPTAGSGNAGGPATFSGTCSVDMGDGTPVTSVPFALAVSTGADGEWTLLMILGATQLPTATVSAGSITVQ